MSEQKTSNTPPQAEPKKVKNIDVAREVFNRHLPRLTAENEADRITGKVFRKHVIGDIMESTGCSLASAASMYNVCKKDAEAKNLVTGLGRQPKENVTATAADASTAEGATEATSKPWGVFDGEQLVSEHASKKEAKAAATGEQKVRKIAQPEQAAEATEQNQDSAEQQNETAEQSTEA